MKNLIIIDFPVSDNKTEFSESLSNYSGLEWEVYSKVSNRPRKNIFIKIQRYLLYAFCPFSLFLRRKEISNIVAWQQFYGLFFAFYSSLFKVEKKVSLIIMTFIYKKKRGILGKAYYHFIKKCVDNDYVDLIICFSVDEIYFYCEEFAMKKEKFIFFPLAIENKENDVNINDRLPEKKYIFSTGYSNRNYEFLIESLKNTEYELIIASPNLSKSNYKNIQILDNCFDDKMNFYMSQAYCVVIPLKDKVISSGQLVALQAMQMKKPIIATNSEGLKYYIRDSFNGFLIENTKEELLSTLNLLYQDVALYEKLANNCYEEFKSKYSIDRLAHEIADDAKKKSIFNH